MRASYLCSKCGRFTRDLLDGCETGDIRCSCGGTASFENVCCGPVKGEATDGFVARMSKESPPYYNEWYHSEETQRKIRTGELVHPRKSDNVFHR